MKRSVISFAIAVITAVAMFAGCVPKAAQTDEPASPVPTAEQVSPTAGDVAEEPVFTLTDLPDDVELPDFYTEVIIPGVENRVFAFTDTTGSVQLRVYGVRSVFSASGEPEDVSAGFFPAQITQTGNDEQGNPLYSIQIMDGVQGPVQTADENAGVGTPVEPDDGVLVPEGFEPLDGVEGLFFYSPEEDVVYYFSYCEFSEEIDGFYPADENGTVAPGTLPVTLDEEGNVLVVLNIDGEIIYVNAVVNISADEENAGEGDAAEDDNKPNPPSGGSTPRPTPTPMPTPTPTPTPTPGATPVISGPPAGSPSEMPWPTSPPPPTPGATPVISGPPAGSPSGMPTPTPTPGDEGGGNVSDPPSPTPEGTGGGENGSTSD